MSPEAQACVEALVATPREQATSVIGELLKARPELAPNIVGFACPDLTYAPARALNERRAMGTMKSFSAKNGFGFIACPELLQVFGFDVFLHGKQMGPFASVLSPGTPVTFAVVLNKDNKPQAYDVQPMDGALCETAIASAMGDHASTDPAAVGAFSGPSGGTFSGVEAALQGACAGTDAGLMGACIGAEAAGAYGWGAGQGGLMDGFAAAASAKGVGKAGPTSGMKRKFEDPAAELGRFSGRVKSFNPEKGFGFILSEDLQAQGIAHDVFLHHTQAPHRCQAGQAVVFTAFLNDKGQPQAKDVEAAG